MFNMGIDWVNDSASYYWNNAFAMEIIEFIGLVIIVELGILVWHLIKVRTGLKKIYELYWTRTHGEPMNRGHIEEMRIHSNDF